MPRKTSSTSTTATAACSPNRARPDRSSYYDRETSTHYNYFRDYDPSTGRYVQSDPIGLRGGINTYSYATENPLLRVDPLGLVDWSGTFAGGTVGRGGTAGLYYFDLKSQCVNGKRGHVKGWALGVGFGLGIDISFTTSPANFKDHESTPNPDIFEGNFLYGQGGLSLCSKTGCGGISYTGILQLGGAYAEAGWGSSKGLDFGANIIGGRSKVTYRLVEPCCDK
ncbi:MAG: RHS repeat-associated core domain-containing protein [Rhodocyclales bacterium]|nr:RHS repeat-associated core domain-containing protein [Rhodocyclales bacterium]